MGTSQTIRTFKLYEDAFYKCNWDGSGACKAFQISGEQCLNLDDYNDKVSSIDTLGNCMMIWEHPHCTGDSVEIGPLTMYNTDLRGLKMSDGRNWDDQMSSISVSPRLCCSGYFECRNYVCIKPDWVCDGQDDCSDGEDEIHCNRVASVKIDHRPIKSTKQIIEGDGVRSQAHDGRSTIPVRNCSTKETYCHRDAKCIQINETCRETELQVHDGVGTSSAPDKTEINRIFVTSAIVLLVILLFSLIIFMRQRKNRNASTTRTPGIILQPRNSHEMQPFFPQPRSESIFPLPPPWKTNPSLICLSPLGEGFFGKVYQVEDQSAIVPPTEYAIKCIDMVKKLKSCSPSYTTSGEESSRTRQNCMTTLLNEMQIMDQLSCDHVVRYYGCWAEAEDCSQLLLTKSRLEKYIREVIEHCNSSASYIPSSPLSHIFIRMELCNITLKKYLEVFRWRDELGIVTQIAAGLLYVHRKGYIHRDIKPGNIFCKVESGGKSTWKVGDFGLTVMSSEVGNSGVAGTYLYQSPEMRNELSYTDRTDLYSLGLVGAEILHGIRKNFNRNDVFAHLRKLGGTERRNYLNSCYAGKYKKLICIINQLLNVQMVVLVQRSCTTC
ncbi:G-type lectin S-receptor-like serine/threonine-protein kinase SD1-13 [Folsomia candida]|uniref:G-type lectin S-receptor-like serine/threonine-protein kinase SD1-13 n=1 Tax=Folsomia candida TaxID=158441 RepID=UPI001604B8C5|nr:G-type lectin S-receptor-like serine/threonine-protein kinase SD1-13 [Folsomia candida]XP_035712642.1 G-type lectin S-receptor-like serine/threonine-protein kinase SD1-13 [Folsomia candida]XP_035712643.1 G-type lectin S-receptor-like serine/threonine-protein kinase SD1-13 [Folsomia candida]